MARCYLLWICGPFTYFRKICSSGWSQPLVSNSCWKRFWPVLKFSHVCSQGITSSKQVGCQQVNLYEGSLRGSPGTSIVFPFTGLNPCWFSVRCCGDLFSWHWNPGLGSLVWGWALWSSGTTAAVQISLQSLNYHMCVWNQPFHNCTPSPLPQPLAASLCMAYRGSVQLVFGWFSRVIVL